MEVGQKPENAQCQYDGVFVGWTFWSWWASHQPTFKYLLEAAGTQSTYLQGRKAPPKTAKKISNFVVDNLEQKYKKLGTNSSVYTTEQKFFEDNITKTFYNLMEDALMNAGYGPL